MKNLLILLLSFCLNGCCTNGCFLVDYLDDKVRKNPEIFYSENKSKNHEKYEKYELTHFEINDNGNFNMKAKNGNVFAFRFKYNKDYDFFNSSQKYELYIRTEIQYITENLRNNRCFFENEKTAANKVTSSLFIETDLDNHANIYNPNLIKNNIEVQIKCYENEKVRVLPLVNMYVNAHYKIVSGIDPIQGLGITKWERLAEPMLLNTVSFERNALYYIPYPFFLLIDVITSPILGPFYYLSLL